jgi:hypothetical protein
MNLTTIKVLYRDRNLALWGIPYKMKTYEECGGGRGQEPRDLDNAGNHKGWIYLGNPGWYGAMSPEEQIQIKNFLEDQDPPGSYPEWCEVYPCPPHTSPVGPTWNTSSIHHG